MDEATQKLLDQAKEAGYVGDQFKSAQDRMIDAVNKLIERLDVLIRTLSHDLPGAIENIPGLDIPVRFTDRGGGYVPGKPIDPELPEYARGSGGLRNFGGGTLAWLHGREAVLTEGQLADLGGRGVTVNVDARGALLNDPASQAQLATLISNAVMRDVTLRTRVQGAV